MADRDPSVSRRKLLLYGLAGTTAVAGTVIGGLELHERIARAQTLTAGGPGVASPTGKLTRRRRLGKTGLEIGVVGIGAGGLEGTGPIHRAVDRGMNYIDTSACYGDGSSENIIGRAIVESPSLRDKLVIATKWDAGVHMPKERILQSLDQSLSRLKTDHVEVMLIHNVGGDHMQGDVGPARLDNPELYAAMDAAKRSGKVRFFGASGHSGDRAAVLGHAIDKGFDMLLVKMNFLDYEKADVHKLLAKAKAKDVGVVVMKSQPNGGAIPPGFEKARWNVFQANLRWCLQQDIACVVHSGVGVEEKIQDLAIGAVHDELGANETELLERYADAMSPEYCRGCKDQCTTACPEGVAIPEVLRARMYDHDYATPAYRAYARQVYGELEPGSRWAERCLTCDECTKACPWGVDAAGRVREARALG